MQINLSEPMQKSLRKYDERRILAVPGDGEKTLQFSVEHFLTIGNAAIKDHGFFAVALSGGSTPKKIYQALSSQKYKDAMDWSKVYLFWSDERSVPPNHPDSNYRMAMEEGGLKNLPLKQENIFRLKAEENIEKNAAEYEKIINQKLGNTPFDLIMLGMGDDGHTASLFPHTEGVKINNRKVIANFVQEKNTWRATFTYLLINSASNSALYVLGKEKAEKVFQVLTSAFDPETLPSQGVGTKDHPALWILDDGAAAEIKKKLGI